MVPGSVCSAGLNASTEPRGVGEYSMHAAPSKFGGHWQIIGVRSGYFGTGTIGADPPFSAHIRSLIPSGVSPPVAFSIRAEMFLAG